jgi:hypothetical protein
MAEIVIYGVAVVLLVYFFVLPTTSLCCPYCMIYLIFCVMFVKTTMPALLVCSDVCECCVGTCTNTKVQTNLNISCLYTINL